MKTVLGIGTAGANVVSQLSQYKAYQAYTISKNTSKTTKYKFSLPSLPGPEEYEAMDTTKLNKWLSTIKEQCTVFLCGASLSSGITLLVLEELYKREVRLEIVYFVPEVEVLSEERFLQERACRGILQNYARSGLFEKICLVSNVALERLAGSTNVIDYYDQINHVFTSTYYMMDVFKNTKAITSTFKKPKDHCRITTIGLDSVHADEKLFFPLVHPTESIH